LAGKPDRHINRNHFKKRCIQFPIFALRAWLQSPSRKRRENVAEEVIDRVNVVDDFIDRGGCLLTKPGFDPGGPVADVLHSSMRGTQADQVLWLMHGVCIGLLVEGLDDPDDVFLKFWKMLLQPVAIFDGGFAGYGHEPAALAPAKHLIIDGRSAVITFEQGGDIFPNFQEESLAYSK